MTPLGWAVEPEENWMMANASESASTGRNFSGGPSTDSASTTGARTPDWNAVASITSRARLKVTIALGAAAAIKRPRFSW
ncbi:hypothetical protein D3C72_2506400 [compost metagenome]